MEDENRPREIDDEMTFYNHQTQERNEFDIFQMNHGKCNIDETLISNQLVQDYQVDKLIKLNKSEQSDNRLKSLNNYMWSNDSSMPGE